MKQLYSNQKKKKKKKESQEFLFKDSVYSLSAETSLTLSSIQSDTVLSKYKRFWNLKLYTDILHTEYSISKSQENCISQELIPKSHKETSPFGTNHFAKLIFLVKIFFWIIKTEWWMGTGIMDKEIRQHVYFLHRWEKG